MASLLLSTGKYLHTAYAVSNIAEEFTNDDWSLSSQEGFGYIGQYIDDSAVDSSDPTDYVWTEFLDEDVDDLDDEGDMPMADFQSQIDALQDQIEVLQGDAENLQSSIEVNASNVADSAQLASEAADIANATGQYFWHDANGAHVSTEENNPEGERNSIWNSLGMLFRKGATNLLAVLAGGASGTDPKGIAVYDGEGNDAENVVASFTDSGSVIGKAGERRLELDSDSMDLYDAGNRRVFSVLNTTSDTFGTVYEFAVNRGDNKGVGTYTYQLGLPYEGDLVVELLFYNEPNFAGGYGEEYSLNDGDFGNFTFSNVLMSASGNLSFDTDTNTVTLVLSSLTNGYHLSRFAIHYTSYPQYPTVFIGANGDTFDIKDYALVVASPDWEHNVLTIDRDGQINTDGNVIAENLQYNNTGIDTLTLQNYKIDGYVSSGTTSLYVTITTPKSMENISSIIVTKSGATCGVRGVSGYVKDGSTSMENGYSLNKTAFTLAATKDDNYHFTLAITRSSAFSNVTNNTPVSLHIGNMVFTFN